MLLASGYSPIYPCHVPPRDMRQHPIGTGPFKFVEFKPNEYIKVTRNPDYWKQDRPYLDGIEYTIIRNLSTAILAFVAGKFDMTFPYSVTVPLLKDVKSQMPEAICELAPIGVNRNLIVNRDKPPFDNPDLRQAMALSLDRKAFIDIVTDGQGDIGGVMQPPPEGLWGMPPEMLKTLPGYDPDVRKTARMPARSWRSSATGPTSGSRSRCRCATPILPGPGGDPDRPVEGGLHRRRTRNDRHRAIGFPRSCARTTSSALNPRGSGPDPDQNLYLNYGCGGELNYNGYCNPEVDKLIERQSSEADQEKRKQLVWEIERKLAEDGARPIIFYDRRATCWQPQVKGLTMMVNSISNGWRMEDVWLDK